MQVLPPGGDLLAGVLWLIAWAELEVLGFGLSFTHLRTDTGWVFVGNAIGGLAPILATPAITQIMRYALSGAVEVRPGISALVSMRWSITPGGVGLALSF